MASFLNAQLPSDDEDDDDYNVSGDKTAEPEDRMGGKGKGKQGSSGNKRRAPSQRNDDEAEEEEEAEVEHSDDKGTSASIDTSASLLLEDDPDDPRVRAKKAKMDLMWQRLNGGAPKAAATATAAAAAASRGSAAAASVNLAALCRAPAPKRASNASSDQIWMASLGMLPARSPATSQVSPLLARLLAGTKSSPSQSPAGPSTSQQSPASALPSVSLSPALPHDANTSSDPLDSTNGGSTRAVISESSRAAAAAALAALRGPSSLSAAKTAGKVEVTETRRFAGKDITVTTKVDQGSSEVLKAAKRAAAQAEAAKGGMAAMLAEMEKKKKVSVLDKSKMDWKDHKSSDATLEEELELYKKSGGKYLDKVDFLKRSELRQYEQERDSKLAADVRNRGRL